MIIVIHTSEDGLYVSEYSEEEFTKAIADGEYRKIDWCGSVVEFDKEASNNGLILKDAKIVKPKPVSVVTEYRLE